MSGLDFRGRRRFRDSDATERLTALLREEQRSGVDAPWAEHGGGAAVSGGSDPLDEGARVDSRAELDPRDATGPGDGDAPDLSINLSFGQDPGSEHSRHREDVMVRRHIARPALVALCAVLVVALGIGGWNLLPDGQGDDVVTSAVVASEDADGGTGATGAGEGPDLAADAPAGTATTEQAGVLTVHVIGEVKDPSVVTLSPGARVMDAVAAAGGFTKGAVKDRVNLAQPVGDGAQITIPNASNADRVAEAAAHGGSVPGSGTGVQAGKPAAPGGAMVGGVGPAQGGAAASGPAAPGSGAAGGAAALPGGTPVNLNTASQAELETLPRVGPVLAQRIVEFRTQQGPLTSVEQLDDVSGVGPALLEALLPLVAV